jgi:hypothetical protein
MKKFNYLDIILISSLFITVLVSGWLTYIRIMYGTQHITYDSWVFGMNLAMLLTYIDTGDLQGVK